ncbi:orotate phosphoribosyltransferase [Thermotoga maritima MSB8]|uniref:Orotate phosphoribosyltransferase n=1 Tax=Thermotoga maritima (strain ATCC 43589 / DSM 3109 / JCM 10099 / NBRC 100826 / MSB8) TaxID=243274 RepID=PYRE_THEMA|nr:orotate phosphoribosyltransferase [Thermotoga maritima]Q9WYG6.1 RecName: Full=Orotate phosphoribosyltransferase; Short=OPRT; Short=OPRTase [Thermotoga maritima MSB8]AAD35418.1 orotate phosphoribosyltransferase [Thermotoga maritima MSB8]AGL49254.1 Orotate phosphoribosyltransferase [Thermotoga maritima MSB8]AKE26267.1 orotate phosphoribosyltransferase [Thermotoga maritima]AKE28130.1 orotate phosphoribosyltransferase [Thermotoga maritima MSB8]AKE30004.1 orotate phosphoribosyltransferase [Ther
MIKEILEKTGALMEGHFILSSGKHSSRYVQCARLFEFPEYGDVVGEELAKLLKKYDVETVVGPAMGGVILSYVVARYLKARSLFAERENGVMKLRRGFFVKPGEKVAVVEDVVTTGGSVKEVIELLKEYGANVVCVGSIIDRSGGKVDFGVPFESLLKLDLPVYDPEDCPLCKQGIPAEKPGSRGLK